MTTKPSGASEAPGEYTAVTSAATAPTTPTAATTGGPGGLLPSVQAVTNSACATKHTTAYAGWSSRVPKISTVVSPAASSAAKPERTVENAPISAGSSRPARFGLGCPGVLSAGVTGSGGRGPAWARGSRGAASVGPAPRRPRRPVVGSASGPGRG